MASLFDYIFTCDCCKEQLISEGRGEVGRSGVVKIEWELKNESLEITPRGYKKGRMLPTNDVCEYCLEEEDMIPSSKMTSSPWIQHYLQEHLQEITDEEYYIDAPFAPSLTLKECVKVAKNLLQKDLNDQIKTAKRLLTEIVNHPKCNVSKFEKEVLKIFEKGSTTTSSHQNTTTTVSNEVSDMSKDSFFNFYTKSVLLDKLKQLKDTEHRTSWKKDRLISVLENYSMEDVLALFKTQDLRDNLNEHGLTSKGKKQELIDRLLSQF